MQKEIDLKKEKIRSLNEAWKGYLKTWGFESPAARVTCHKTQSFMKNGGQKKCLDKTLYASN